jgi:GMP synthase (glutamine-hydrolysing)
MSHFPEQKSASHGRRRPVVILDFGSQVTQLIARRVRELAIYCEIHPYTVSLDRIRELDPPALILSGGPASVLDDDAPRVAPELLQLGIPVLGICYGLQLMVELLGGRVAAGEGREYGGADLEVLQPVGPLAAFAAGEKLSVWMSHGDRVEALPSGFEAIGASEGAPLAAVAHRERRFFGVQFHPEVVHTPRGKDMLQAFLVQEARCDATWTERSFVEEAVERLREQIGQGRVVLGLSGGVDSSVAAALLHRAIGDRLSCIFVDNGLLRQDEVSYVVQVFDQRVGLKVNVIDSSRRFLDALSGVEDPEEKRKIIGGLFIEDFEEAAAQIGGVDFLAQGTLYPDVIESVSVRGPAAVIKSHHNVGGLPERMKLKLVEPLRELFKDEVRAVGELLGLPEELVWRQPFPGPGLAVRILGEVTPRRVATVRHADAIVEEEVRAAGLYRQLWQAFAVLLPVRTVGVMGDDRTYDNVVAIRAVESQDAMTADWARVPYPVLERISNRIIREVSGVNRVAYDISSKPPATIEWE